MLGQYGGCVISFNFILPLLAYSYPSPFTSSMLSRVTYDDNEFVKAIPYMGFNLEDPEEIERQLAILESASQTSRIDLIANWTTEKLCLFAPNIKKPEFAFEQEWRLKSAISTYSSDPSLSRRPQYPPMFDLPETASITEGSMSRYSQRLTFSGDKFISSGIWIFSNDASDLSAWVGQWQKDESMPALDIDEFSTVIRRQSHKSSQ